MYYVCLCSTQVTFSNVPLHFDKWLSMNVFGSAGLVMFYVQNRQPMIYVWKNGGRNTGYVTFTYENVVYAQNAVQLFNNSSVMGHYITAVMSNYVLPPPNIPNVTRNQVQRGKHTHFLSEVLKRVYR